MTFVTFVDYMFNEGQATIQDVIELNKEGFVMVCNDGKVKEVFHEPKED